MTNYKPAELCLINVTSRIGGSDWANEILDAVREIKPNVSFAPDYDGTTTGNPDGINVLILAADLQLWIDVIAANEADVEKSALEVTAGHYGDGGWAGVDLVETEDGSLQWIE